MGSYICRSYKRFVSGVTIGYKEYRDGMGLPTYIHSAAVWKSIIGEYADNNFLNTEPDFEPVRGVIESPWCTTSGLIAGQGCPRSSQMGYWKESNAPYCNGGHYVAPEPTEPVYNTQTGGDTGTGDQTGGGAAGGDVTGGGGDVGGGDIGGGTAGGDVTGGGDWTGGGGDVGGGTAGGGGDVGGGDTGGGGDVGGGDVNQGW
ncbi:MAG: hypothetical protein IKK91_01760 [Ruminococcus sp.]|nr:hypothetical protein [Ruminococcus sp.]